MPRIYKGKITHMTEYLDLRSVGSRILIFRAIADDKTEFAFEFQLFDCTVVDGKVYELIAKP